MAKKKFTFCICVASNNYLQKQTKRKKENDLASSRIKMMGKQITKYLNVLIIDFDENPYLSGKMMVFICWRPV